jgi:hypothetical protein
MKQDGLLNTVRVPTLTNKERKERDRLQRKMSRHTATRQELRRLWKLKGLIK